MCSKNIHSGRSFAPQHGGSGRSFAPQHGGGDRSFAPQHGGGGKSFVPQHNGAGRSFDFKSEKSRNNSYSGPLVSNNLDNGTSDLNPYSSVDPASAEDIFVVEGGVCKCSEGEKKTGIKATTTTATTFGTKMALTKSCITMEEDEIFGECKKLTKEKQQKEKDKGNGNWEKDGIVQCKGKYKPVPEEWKPAVTTVSSNGEEAISIISQLVCEHGGIISIVKNGQGGGFDQSEDRLNYLSGILNDIMDEVIYGAGEAFFNGEVLKGLYYGLENAFFANSYSLVASQSAFNLTTGTLGKFIPFAALAFDFAMDFHDGKTIGQATTHIGFTSIVGATFTTAISASLVLLGFGTPVGWVAIGIGVVASFGANILYNNNVLHIQDGADWVADKIDGAINSVGEAISGTFDNIKACFGW